MIESEHKQKAQKTHNQQPSLLEQDLHLNLANKQIPATQSPYTEAYLKTMNSIPPISHQTFEKQVLFNHQTFFCSGIHSKIIHKNPNCNIYQVRAYFSYFHFDMYINYCQGNPQSRVYLSKIGSGDFGTIYGFDNNYAIKNIYFTKQNKALTIRRAIQEYCLYQIASILRIGPKLTQLFGFDLIVYQNYVQFSMQKCTRPHYLDKTEILASIKLLHEFKIIHGDIKEDNIMYSPSFQKNVLIGYNCSSVIAQSVGEKTLTLFKGTHTRCYKEMQDLYMKTIPREVDMYYNDVVCWQQLDQTQFNTKKKSRPEKKDSLSEMEEFICSMRHMNLRLLLFRNNSEQIFQYVKQHSSELVPSKRLQDQLQQKITQKPMKVLEMYHQIYAEIVKLINETYEIGIHTNWRKIAQRQRVIKNLFKGYINLQKVSLRLTEKKKVLQGYLECNYFITNETHIKQISRKLWACDRKQAELGGFNALFDAQRALKRLKEDQIPKAEVKYLYYNILSASSVEDDLSEVVMETFYKICLPQKTKLYQIKEGQIEVLIKESEWNKELDLHFRIYPYMMMNIDSYFKKGKSQKFKIWRKLKNYRSHKGNFITRIIAEICTIYSASSNSYEKHGAQLVYNLEGFIKDISILRNNRIQFKTMNLFEKIVLSLIRILRETTYENKEELIALSKAIKDAQLGENEKIYLDNIETLRLFIQHCCKKQFPDDIEYLEDSQGPNLLWESNNLNLQTLTKQNSLLTSYLDHGKIAGFLIEYKPLLDPQLQLSNLQHWLEALGRGSWSQTSHLYSIYRILSRYQGQIVPLPQKALMTLERLSYYFCAFELSELSHMRQIRLCLDFNIFYFSIYSLKVPKRGDDFSKLQTRYISWLDQQYPNFQYPIDVYTGLLSTYMYHGSIQKYQSLLKQSLQVNSLFELIENKDQFSKIIKCRGDFFNPSYQGQDVTSVDELQIQIYLERMIYIKDFEIERLIYYYRLKQDYGTLFWVLSQWAVYCQNSKYSRVVIIGLFLPMYQYFNPFSQLIQQSNFFLYHKNHILSLENCQPSLTIVNLALVVNLATYAQTMRNTCAKLACYQYMEKCLIAIFRRIQQCLSFIRQRIIENIGQPFKAIQKAKKHFSSQQQQLLSPIIMRKSELKIYQDLTTQQLSPAQYISQYKFKIHPLSKLSLRQLDIYHLRRSILNQCMPYRHSTFLQICEKLCSKEKIKNQLVRKYIEKKIRRLVDNKLEAVAAPKLDSQNSHFSSFRESYLNSINKQKFSLCFETN